MATRKSSRPSKASANQPQASEPALAEHQQAERSELAALGEQIRYHERAYREGAPEVSDAVFDELMARYFDHFDEAHPSAAARALERIDVEDSLIKRSPGQARESAEPQFNGPSGSGSALGWTAADGRRGFGLEGCGTP